MPTWLRLAARSIGLASVVTLLLASAPSAFAVGPFVSQATSNNSTCCSSVNTGPVISVVGINDMLLILWHLEPNTGAANPLTLAQITIGCAAPGSVKIDENGMADGAGDGIYSVISAITNGEGSCSVSVTQTMSINCTVTCTAYANVYEVQGYTNVGDSVVTGSGTSNPSATSSKVFTGSPLLVAFISATLNCCAGNPTAGTGFTLFGIVPQWGGNNEYAVSGVSSPTTFPFTNLDGTHSWGEVGLVFPAVTATTKLYAQNFPNQAIMETWVLTMVALMLLPWLIVAVFKQDGDVMVTVWLACSAFAGLLGSLAGDQAQAAAGDYGIVPWGITFYLFVALIVWLIKGGGH